jgi:RsiW-degrading membrane proteinase PrsW (M82 family)
MGTGALGSPMSEPPEPLEHAADEAQDLHGIATWEPRSLFDRLLARYTWVVVRLSVVLLAVLLFLVELVLIALQVVSDPESLLVVVLFPISVVPAAVLALYVWYTDITTEPWLLLVGTYVLGVLLATFPTVVNTVTLVAIEQFVPGGFVGWVVEITHFFLVVAPGEEAAKLAAVFAFAYWHREFDTVVDGAVYGAVAGLGFATIENVSYIVQTLAGTSGPVELVVGGGLITVVRSIAGPGHVIWTAIAGYYLGLAKFNDEYWLAITVKGLLVAVFLHGFYNSTTTTIGAVASTLGVELLALPVTFGFIVVFHAVTFTYLILKLRRYRKAYAAASPGEDAAPVDEIDGYDGQG